MLFFRRRSPVSTASPDGYYFVEDSAALLCRQLSLVKAIQVEVGIPDAHWKALYQPVLENYALLTQQFPASEAHHHAELGGLLRHGLEAVLEALHLRRTFLLPHGAQAEQIAREQDLWTYATATCALLHDVGKPITDLVVTVMKNGAAKDEAWELLTKPLPAGAYYRYRFNRARRYSRHALIPPLLATRILPERGLNWLASEPTVFDGWLATISGDDESILARISRKADGASVARDLSGGTRTRSPEARAKPLSDRLLTELRHLVREGHITLNRPGAAGFVADGCLWLVSKRALDDLRTRMVEQGQTGIPGRNDRLMDELQQWQIIQPNGDKAVWHCVVKIGDWEQALSCLCLNVQTIWPSLEDCPAAVEVTVQVRAEASDEQVPVSPVKAADPPMKKQIGSANAIVEDRCDVKPAAPSEVSEAVSSNDPYADLPMPFDTPGQQDPGLNRVIEVPAGADKGRENNTPVASGESVSAGTGVIAGVNDDLGPRFVRWLSDNISNGRVDINTARARLHVLPEGLALVTPGIFRDFSPEHWDRAQKRFQKLRLHAKTAKDTNVWTCRVAKDRKQSTLKVMLLKNPENVLGVSLPPLNKAVSLLD